MNTVMPEGESIKKAIQWVSEKLEENREANVVALVNRAISRFDLSPKDAEFLLRFYKKRECACNS